MLRKLIVIGKCESEIFFLPQLLISRIYAVDSKLLNLEEVSLRGILFYIICVFGRDIDRQKFCKYGWDDLFQKSSIVKECGDENLVVSSDRNKIAIEIHNKAERAKK
jgi:hypothetical protein